MRIRRKNYIMCTVIVVVFGRSIESVVVSPVTPKQRMACVVATSHAHAMMLLFIFHARQSSMLFGVRCPKYCSATSNTIASYGANALPNPRRYETKRLQPENKRSAITRGRDNSYEPLEVGSGWSGWKGRYS